MRLTHECLVNCSPCLDQALLNSPSHLPDGVGDFISGRVGKAHVEKTSRNKEVIAVTDASWNDETRLGFATNHRVYKIKAQIQRHTCY